MRRDCPESVVMIVQPRSVASLSEAMYLNGDVVPLVTRFETSSCLLRSECRLNLRVLSLENFSKANRKLDRFSIMKSMSRKPRT